MWADALKRLGADSTDITKLFDARKRAFLRAHRNDRCGEALGDPRNGGEFGCCSVIEWKRDAKKDALGGRQHREIGAAKGGRDRCVFGGCRGDVMRCEGGRVLAALGAWERLVEVVRCCGARKGRSRRARGGGRGGRVWGCGRFGRAGRGGGGGGRFGKAGRGGRGGKAWWDGQMQELSVLGEWEWWKGTALFERA